MVNAGTTCLFSECDCLRACVLCMCGRDSRRTSKKWFRAGGVGGARMSCDSSTATLRPDRLTATWKVSEMKPESQEVILCKQTRPLINGATWLTWLTWRAR